MIESIFSRLISGEVPSYKVAESEDFLAFLDINPNSLGHTLCIPKKVEDKLFNLTEEEYVDLMSFSRKVALALRKVVKCERIGMSVIGLEVSHVHVHLIPINQLEDMTFQKKVRVDSKTMSSLADDISFNFIY